MKNSSIHRKVTLRYHKDPSKVSSITYSQISNLKKRKELPLLPPSQPWSGHPSKRGESGVGGEGKSSEWKSWFF